MKGNTEMDHFQKEDNSFEEFLRSDRFTPYLRFWVFIALLVVLLIAVCGIVFSYSFGDHFDLLKDSIPYTLLALGAIFGLVVNAR